MSLLNPEVPTARIAPYLLVLGFVGALFSGVFSGKVLFWSDTHLSFEPLFAQLGGAIRAGSILWNSLLETGKPILANPTQASLYPPNLLFALFPSFRVVSWLTLIHVAWGAIGIYILARRLDLRRPEALASALVFASAGTTLSGIPYHGLSWCTAWVPWLLFFTDRVSCGVGRMKNAILLAGIVLMMLTIAEPFVLLAANLGVLLWLADRCFRGEGPWVGRLRQDVIPPCLAASAAVVVASPYLVAVLNNLPHSVRSLGFTWDGVTVWSLHPLHLVEWVAPGIFGFIGRPEHGVFWATALTPEKGFPLFPSIYVGGVALALVIAGFWKRMPQSSSLAAWLAVLVLLAMGRWGPFYPVLDGMPGFDAARFPIKWLVPAMVPFSLLVGLGLHNVVRTRDHRSRSVVLVALACVAAFLAALATVADFSWFTNLTGAIVTGDHGRFSPDDRDVLLLACFRGLMPVLASIGVLVVARRKEVRSQIVVGALAAVVALDLFAANARLVETIDADFYEQVPEALQIIRSDPGGVDRIRIDEAVSVAPQWAIKAPTLAEISKQQRQTLSGYVSAHYGMATALTRDTEATGPSRMLFLKVLAESAPPREQAMIYGSAAISHLVTDREIGHPALSRLGTARTIGGSPVHVYRNALVQPRVSIVPSIIPYSGDEGFRRAVQGSTPDLFSNAVLIDSEDLKLAPTGVRELIPKPHQGPTDHTSDATITEDGGHRLEIAAVTDTPAVLVISDAYLPQWSAEVDGLDAPVFQVNYCFRGVLLDEGSHTVVLTYSPWRR